MFLKGDSDRSFPPPSLLCPRDELLTGKWTKKEFHKEFDFKNKIFLEKGGFGEVRKCKSKLIIFKDYAIEII